MNHWRICIAPVAAVLLATGCAGVNKSTSDRSFQKRHGDSRYCRIETVRQSSPLSCGAAAMSSVLHYWGKPLSEEAILIRYPSRSSKGYPILQLRDIARMEGLYAYALKMDKSPLASLMGHVGKGRPVIVAVVVPTGRFFDPPVPVVEHLGNPVDWVLGRHMGDRGDPKIDHYVVVIGESEKKGKTDAKILIMDPSHGIVAVRRDIFKEYWRSKDFSALVCAQG